jgi:UDPglucose--hexose-1-phosphate uridylyltransferase
VDTLTSQFQELVARPGIRHVQIFENRGEMMGCSNPHPHCQIWANETVPNEAAKEHAAMREYRDAHESCLLCDYAALEQRLAERIVCKNESFVAMVPFWAVWPFEIMLLSRRHIPGLDALTNSERNDLASIMGRIGARYDNLFDAPFPYSMGFHQGALEDGCHLHAHYYPPLLRSATVRKFMVGYEILAMPQRDLTPESAAERLRATPEHIV